MSYKDYFTLGAFGMAFAVVFLLVSIILYFKFDIGYITRLFLKKFKIVGIVVFGTVILSGATLYSKEEIDIEYYYITEISDVTIKGMVNLDDVEGGNSLWVEYLSDEENKGFDIFSIPEGLEFTMYEGGEFEIGGIGSDGCEYKEGEYVIYKTYYEDDKELKEEAVRAIVLRDESPVRCGDISCDSNLYREGNRFYMNDTETIFSLGYIETESGIDPDRSIVAIGGEECSVNILNDEIIFDINSVERTIKSGYNKIVFKIYDKAGHLTEAEFEVVYDTDRPVSNVRFPDDAILEGQKVYFTGEGTIFDLSLYIGDNIGVKEVELVRDGLLVKTLKATEMVEREWFPLSVELNDEVTDISIICYDYANNTDEKSFNLIRDASGPVISKDAVKVTDAKGIIGINKRFLAYFTKDDTVVVSVSGVRDDKSGVDSVMFIHSGEDKGISIRARYDEKEDEFYAICNIPRNSSRDFKVLARDKLGNVTFISDDVNIYNDSSKPEIAFGFEGEFRKEDDKIYYKSLDAIRICIKDELALDSVRLVVNGRDYLFDDKITGKDNTLVKEMVYHINPKEIDPKETVCEIVSNNLCEAYCNEKIVFISDNTPPKPGELFINEIKAKDIENNDYSFEEKVKVSFDTKDFDDRKKEKGGRTYASFTLFSQNGKRIREGSLKRDGEKFYFFIEPELNGFAVIRVWDEFKNEYEFKTPVIRILSESNSLEHTETSDVDIVSPKMTISFSDGKSAKYFNTDRVLQLFITERNFHRDNLDFIILFEGKSLTVNPDFKVIKNLDNPDLDVHFSEILLDKEGEYSVSASFKDMAGNTCPSVSLDFLIDKTPPKCTVTMDRAVGENGFINHAVGVKIQVTDKNFSESLISVSGENITKQTPFELVEGSYVSFVSFEESGECGLEVEGRDLAGNVLNKVSLDKFIVDLIKPNVLIHDLINYKSYNNKVSFDIMVSDEYLDMDNSSIKMISESNGCLPTFVLDKEIGVMRFIVDSIPVKKEYDGIYRIELTGIDYSGNSVSESYRFSVNRFGSAFSIVGNNEELSGKYLKTISDIGIREVNFDEVNPESTRVFLFKNGQTRALLQDRDYSVTTERDGFLNSVIYEIDKGNFNEDGVYALSLYSSDTAGNYNQSIRDRGLISFVVDRTPPRVYELNKELSGAFEDKRIVKIRAFDNMKLDEVLIFSDKKPLEVKSVGEEYYAFSLDTVNEPVSILAVDAAGNSLETVISDLSNIDNDGVAFSRVLDYILILLIVLECIIIIVWKDLYQRKKRIYFLLRLLRGGEKY